MAVLTIFKGIISLLLLFQCVPSLLYPPSSYLSSNIHLSVALFNSTVWYTANWRNWTKWKSDTPCCDYHWSANTSFLPHILRTGSRPLARRARLALFKCSVHWHLVRVGNRCRFIYSFIIEATGSCRLIPILHNLLTAITSHCHQKDRPQISFCMVVISASINPILHPRLSSKSITLSCLSEVLQNFQVIG